MITEKSTISSLMSSKLNMTKISLYDRKRLGIFYSKRNEFNDLNEPISSLESNRHFVNMPCNEQLSTIQEFTNGKTMEEISNELLYKIINKDYKNQSDLECFHHKL